MEASEEDPEVDRDGDELSETSGLVSLDDALCGKSVVLDG